VDDGQPRTAVAHRDGQIHVVVGERELGPVAGHGQHLPLAEADDLRRIVVVRRDQHRAQTG
jgi:hypothetical protein